MADLVRLMLDQSSEQAELLVTKLRELQDEVITIDGKVKILAQSLITGGLTSEDRLTTASQILGYLTTRKYAVDTLRLFIEVE